MRSFSHAELRVMPARRVSLCVLAAVACAPPTVHSLPEPAGQQPDSAAPSRPPVLPSSRPPAAPAALAQQRGWMPLASTGVLSFLAAHPSWDGRGVLIAILDSGIDPAVPGLDSTSTGRRKVLDLRDFSGEGRIALVPLIPRGDTVEFSGQRLAGFGRVRGLAAGGPWYGGSLRERALGEPPASDLNDNGSDADTLVVVVARASDGWVLFADTDGDGSLANERPVHDFLIAHETFGWHRPGSEPPLNLAVNLSSPTSSTSPSLSLVFDTDAHGTHVAGIAAAHGIGGAAGFDGVAPGAQLLGLKISRNDFGGLTTTGSVLAALEYAIRFAGARQLPLVVNMSFGVGNEREGAARLDTLLDSMLTAHPEVVFVTSAGNDGPGLSTLGFPGSVRRGITVGATEPAVFFSPPGRTPPALDPLLFFSSRGGELAKPDLVAPGTAYSTVPRWNRGEEFKSGTSMASPHVAGLAAILLSAAVAEHREVRAEDLRRALSASGRPLPGLSVLDAGAGLPELASAWLALKAPAPAVAFDVELAGRPGNTAAFSYGPADTVVRFRIRRVRGSRAEALELSFSSDASWLEAPRPIRLTSLDTVLTLVQHPPDTPGVYTAQVRATGPETAEPLFRLVSTVVVPESREVAPVRVSARLSRGAERRVVFAAEAGRPFRVGIASAPKEPHLIAALHQPGGIPVLGDNGIPGGADSAAASFDVDGRDALSGFWEAVAVAPFEGAVTAELSVAHSPVSLRLGNPADSLGIELTSLVDSLVTGRFNVGLLGGERSLRTGGTGGADVLVPVLIPAWASRIVVDLLLEPEQWPRFTDFGLTLLDGDGRILGKNPANYAHSRLSIDLPRRSAEQTATIALAPGFAEPGSQERWSALLNIRLEASPPVVLETRGAGGVGDEFRLAGKAVTRFNARIAEPPWPLPEGFDPLGIFLVESGGISWSWQLPLLRQIPSH